MEPYISNDAFFKLVFESPVVVESLLKTFLPADIWKSMDFATLSLYESGFKGDKGEGRSGDRIWRVSLGDSECYLMIMLEFQSRPDHWMAVRFLAYTALLWQSLIRSERLKAGEKLPLVLPLVIYSGNLKWKAPLRVRDLLPRADIDLERFQPAQEYFLLAGDYLAPVDKLSLAECFVRIGQVKSQPELLAELRRLSRILPSELAGLQKLIISWLAGNIYRNTIIAGAFSACGTIEEACAMLEDGIGLKWEEEFKEKALRKVKEEVRAEVLEQCRAEVLEQCRAEVLKQGKAEGLKLGEERGIEMGKRHECLHMLADFLSLRFNYALSAQDMDFLSMSVDVEKLRCLTTHAVTAPDLAAFLDEFAKLKKGRF